METFEVLTREIKSLKTSQSWFRGGEIELSDKTVINKMIAKGFIKKLAKTSSKASTEKPSTTVKKE